MTPFLFRIGGYSIGNGGGTVTNYLVWCTETVTRFKSYLVVLLKRVLLFYTFKFLRLCLTSYVLNLLSMLWLCTYYSIIIHNS